MAIKFSQLPKVDDITADSLVPVVYITTSNVLGVATGTTLRAFVANVSNANITSIQSNVSSLQSNATSQQIALNSLVSSQSSQSTQIGIVQSQVSVLQTNTATISARVSGIENTVQSGIVNALIVNGPLVNTGNITVPNLSIPAATTVTNGYLRSTDWTTFNNKAPTANPTFTGTVTTPEIVPASNAASNIGSPTLQYNTVHARATSAQYADLAELYLADQVYEVGSVLMIGGEKEVTACKFGSRAIGAVSANPSYLMNSGLVGGTQVALKGRVPVKVVGSIKKGDELIASDNGCAIAGIHHSSKVFAVALESNSDTGIKLVEALVL